MSARVTAATTVDDALEALAGGARPIAGGTDLVVGAPQRQGAASRAPGRDPPAGRSSRGIRRRATVALALGALVSHADDRRLSDACATRFTALADASAIVGSHATRSAGTIGGNVMNASPAMETGGAADVPRRHRRRCGRRAGERTVAVDELFTAPGRTVAEPDELLVAVDVPAPPPGTGAPMSGSSIAARWRSRSSAPPPR